MQKSTYTITDKEVFLEYLQKLCDRPADVKPAEDFLPINYFVAPEARFSWEDYLKSENAKYIQAMEERRRLSYPQFLNLRKWALSKGLKEKFEAIDLIEFYFSFGLCGLATEIRQTTKLTRKRLLEHDCSSAVLVNSENIASAHTESILVDCSGNFYTREGKNPSKYKVVHPRQVEKECGLLRGRETLIAEAKKSVDDIGFQWIMPGEYGEEIIISPRVIVMRDASTDRKRMASLSVQERRDLIPRDYWSSEKQGELQTYRRLIALAQALLNKRKVRVNVSSYDALCAAGCSPYSALVYLRNTLALGEADEADEAGVATITTDDHIRKFLQEDDQELDSDVEEFLQECLDGAISIDGLKEGREADYRQDYIAVYKAFYCAHHILGIPLEDIHKAVTELSNLGEPIVFKDKDEERGLTLSVDTARIENAYLGYLSDVRHYRDEQYEQAVEHIWVDTVAREIGLHDGNRHVGVLYYTLPDRAKQLKDRLGEEYYAKVAEVYEHDAKARNKAWNDKAAKQKFIIPAIFTGALSGFWKYPKSLGGLTVLLSEEEQEEFMKCIKGPFVDSTLTISDELVEEQFQDSKDGKLKWLTCCVNAIITPTEVRPIEGYSITEASLTRLWPAVKAVKDRKVVSAFEFVRNFELPSSNHTWQIIGHLHKAGIQLSDYYKGAMRAFKSGKEKKQCPYIPHPLEIMYPRMANLEEQSPTYADPYVLTPRKMSTSSYRPLDVEYITHEHCAVELYDAPSLEDLFTLGDEISYPTRVGNVPIVCDNSRIFTYDPERKEVNLGQFDVMAKDPRYPVEHLGGSRYILCDIYNRYWVVEV